MKNTVRALVLCAALLPAAPAAVAAPFVATATLAGQLDAWLLNTPMAGLGQTLFQQGFFYNVDPRLIVAIAGVQTGYGALAAPDCVNPVSSGSNDPFYLLGCNPGGAAFTSIAAAVQAAAQNIKLNFTTSFGPGSTIDLINLVANQYCATALSCPLQPAAWAQAVEAIYTNPALAGGGDPTDLTFAGATIDFEQLTGPCCFTTYPGPLPVTVGSGTSAVTATFVGGQVLGSASNLPGDQSVLYGTADYCSGCAQTIDIYFSNPVSTLSFFLINGNTVTVTYDTTDDAGNLQTTQLVSNQLGGVGSVTLNDAAILHVNIAGEAAVGGCCTVDFFTDNFTFAY